MNIFISGLYPRDEELIQLTRKHERGFADFNQVLESQQKNVDQLFALQKEFPYASTGGFNWQDLLRPFSELIENANEGPLKRFHETNTFWRILNGEGQPIYSEVSLKEWTVKYFKYSYALPQNWIYNLPFIYLFKEFSEGLSLAEISTLLLRVSIELKGQGGVICLYEPSIGYRRFSEQEKNQGRRLLEQMKSSTQMPIFLWSSFYALKKKERDFYFSLPVDGLGIDFCANSVEEILPFFPKDKILLAGVISTESTLKETFSDFDYFCSQCEKNGLKPWQIYWTFNAAPELLPRKVVDEKILCFREFLSAKKYYT